MADHDSAGCAPPGATPTFPQTNKDICCNPGHSSFGCDYTGIPNGTFSDPAGSVADVVPFMYVGGWPGDPSWGSISSVLPFTVWKGGDDALAAAVAGYDLIVHTAGPFQQRTDPALMRAAVTAGAFSTAPTVAACPRPREDRDAQIGRAERHERQFQLLRPARRSFVAAVHR